MTMSGMDSDITMGHYYLGAVAIFKDYYFLLLFDLNELQWLNLESGAEC